MGSIADYDSGGETLLFREFGGSMNILKCWLQIFARPARLPCW